MAVFGIDELPVKPRMRGWIHLWAFAVSVIAGIVLVTLATTIAEPPAGTVTAIYSLTVCGGVRGSARSITGCTGAIPPGRACG